MSDPTPSPGRDAAAPVLSPKRRSSSRVAAAPRAQRPAVPEPLPAATEPLAPRCHPAARASLPPPFRSWPRSCRSGGNSLPGPGGRGARSRPELCHESQRRDARSRAEASSRPQRHAARAGAVAALDPRPVPDAAPALGRPRKRGWRLRGAGRGLQSVHHRGAAASAPTAHLVRLSSKRYSAATASSPRSCANRASERPPRATRSQDAPHPHGNAQAGMGAVPGAAGPHLAPGESRMRPRSRHRALGQCGQTPTGAALRVLPRARRSSGRSPASSSTAASWTPRRTWIGLSKPSCIDPAVGAAASREPRATPTAAHA